MMSLRHVTIGVFGVSLLFAGCSGDDGAPGAAGPAGNKGEQGDRGEQGQPGEPGEDGAPGEPGENGAPGEPGTPGKDGQDGSNGAAGSDGGGNVGGADGGAGAPATETARTLSFTEVSFATSTLDKHSVRASTAALLNGKSLAIDYHTIVRSNQDPSKANKACDLVNSPTTCAGAMIAANGSVLKDDSGVPRVSNYNDFSSLLEAGESKFLVHSFEETPAQLYVTKLAQGASGELTATATKAVDLSSVDGLYRTCAGSITPWGTHISAEEAQIDARKVDGATTWTELQATRWSELRGMGQYLGMPLLDKAAPADSIEEFHQKFSAYAYGYAVEVSVDASGAADVKKHYAMGRMGMELAYVMPDKKTVYLTDDVTNGGLFMFVADTAGDLSAGTLYAMRVYQLTDAAFKADLTWVNLGHATDAEIKALIHPANNAARIKFDDIFESEAVTGAGAAATCAQVTGEAAYTLVRGNGDDNPLECLRVKPGMDKAASRLETRRYSVIKGATAELTKEEGLTYDPTRNRLYVALSDITGSMLTQSGGPDHINVTANRCGAVFSLDLAPLSENGAVVTQYAAKNWNQLVAGSPYANGAKGSNGYDTCSSEGIASPDNVTYLPGYDVLVIGEDTGTGHLNDAMWTYDLTTSKLTRILSTPYGSEVTSPYWNPNFGGHGYLTAVVQHPYTEDMDKIASTIPTEPQATGNSSYVGVMGPFPALDK